MGNRLFLCIASISLVFIISLFSTQQALAAWSNQSIPVCNHPPDSLSGYGEIQIGGTFITCDNNPDGVCPEDYQDANNASIYGNCANCIDPDCTGMVNGYVKDLYGNSIYSATVKVDPFVTNASAPSLERVTITDINGYYSMASPT